jgi:hypothetical protein
MKPKPCVGATRNLGDSHQQAHPCEGRILRGSCSRASPRSHTDCGRRDHAGASASSWRRGRGRHESGDESEWMASQRASPFVEKGLRNSRDIVVRGGV